MSDEQVYRKTYQKLFDQVFGPSLRAAADVVEQLVEALRPVIKAVMDAVRRMYDWMRGAYQDAGAPYGDTHDGLARWWQELLEVERLRHQAEMRGGHF